MNLRTFLQTMAPVVGREPSVFFEAVLAVTTVDEVQPGHVMITLKKPKVRWPTSPII